MSEGSKHGTVWHDHELDVIVADYFAMLSNELSGEPYVKLRHSSAVMLQIDRTHRSVEFKYQNISAVLVELGLPWIPGYKPKENYQNALFYAVDRYLSHNSSAFDMDPQEPASTVIDADVFVPRPEPVSSWRGQPAELRSLVR